MAWTAAIALLLLAGWAWEAHLRRGAEKQTEEQWELRYPSIGIDDEAGRTVVDFVGMLYVVVTPEKEATVFHLRRRSGPTWEISEESASLARCRERLSRSLADGGVLLDPMRRDRLAAAGTWKEIADPQMEPAYQRFLLHYRSSVGGAWNMAEKTAAADPVRPGS